MQPIFSRNIDINKIAFLNWRIYEDSDILNIRNVGEGFLLSAIELSKQCLKNNKHKEADILIFPILSNINHGIEMYLKALNLILCELVGLPAKVEKTHNIQKLFTSLESKIKVFKGNFSLKEFTSATKDLKLYIAEVTKKIGANEKNDKMDFSRYPFNTNNDNHFYVNYPGNVEVDLENFVTRFTKIKEDMDNLIDFLYHVVLRQET